MRAASEAIAAQKERKALDKVAFYLHSGGILAICAATPEVKKHKLVPGWDSNIDFQIYVFFLRFFTFFCVFLRFFLLFGKLTLLGVVLLKLLLVFMVKSLSVYPLKRFFAILSIPAAKPS